MSMAGSSNRCCSGRMMLLLFCYVFIIPNNIIITNAGWIDVDTPTEKYTTKSFVDGSTYNLVMSDEFNVPGRTFEDGDDPIWTGLDKSDDDSNAAGGGSLHFYNSSTITTTEDGMLRIDANLGDTHWNHYDPRKKEFKPIKKYFKSGMMQSWNKFCFTGGIVEFDIILPGDPHIGGLWPAVWILGNLGRATYEASTNNIWPWSYDVCDRDLQQAQTISACNEQNHFGLNKRQGRGATEIDILEVMAGAPEVLVNTVPPIKNPYIDLTLQVAPGIPFNRPTSGYQPIRRSKMTKSGHLESIGQVWYEGLELYGNTSLNPYFYGTYLGKTKPEEPVTRTEKQAFQADAIGAMHQITPAHFKKLHSFRVEWQPGPKGRIDWFVKAHKKNSTMDNSTEGDGKGQEWVKALTIKDESINGMMNSQIPNEPSCLIMNIAISSSWGFPYKFPAFCKKCYNCNDPTCHCSFAPGFCQMLKQNVSMYIDHIRVYQSHNMSAHPGNNHTVGCDPPEYPSKEWIKGHEYMYSRQAPFSYDDIGPLKKIKKGGGGCETDKDCGAGDVESSIVQGPPGNKELSMLENGRRKLKDNNTNPSSTFIGGRGKCVPNTRAGRGMIYSKTTSKSPYVCKCNNGFTGPHCLSINHKDDEKGAYELSQRISIFEVIASPMFPTLLCIVLLVLCSLFAFVLVIAVTRKRKM